MTVVAAPGVLTENERWLIGALGAVISEDTSCERGKIYVLPTTTQEGRIMATSAAETRLIRLHTVDEMREAAQSTYGLRCCWRSCTDPSMYRVATPLGEQDYCDRHIDGLIASLPLNWLDQWSPYDDFNANHPEHPEHVCDATCLPASATQSFMDEMGHSGRTEMERARHTGYMHDNKDYEAYP